MSAHNIEADLAAILNRVDSMRLRGDRIELVYQGRTFEAQRANYESLGDFLHGIALVMAGTAPWPRPWLPAPDLRPGWF